MTRDEAVRKVQDAFDRGYKDVRMQGNESPAQFAIIPLEVLGLVKFDPKPEELSLSDILSRVCLDGAGGGWLIGTDGAKKIVETLTTHGFTIGRQYDARPR